VSITLVVFVLMLAYEELESRVLVLWSTDGVAAAVVRGALFPDCCATLLGIIGALLALPVAAAILMLIDELRVELPGETKHAEDAEMRKKDEHGELEYVAELKACRQKRPRPSPSKWQATGKRRKTTRRLDGEHLKPGIAHIRQIALHSHLTRRQKTTTKSLVNTYSICRVVPRPYSVYSFRVFFDIQPGGANDACLMDCFTDPAVEWLRLQHLPDHR